MFQAQFYIGAVLYKLNQHKSAFKHLENISLSDQAESQWIVKSLMLMWKIQLIQNSSSFLEKISILNQLIQHSPSIEVKTKARDQAVHILQKLKLSELINLQKNSDLSSIEELILFYIGREYVKDKQYSKALSFFKKVLNISIDNVQIEKQARQYISALLSRTKVQPQTVAAVLPLTGPHKKIGKRCLDGLQLGFGLYDQKPSLFKLVTVDSTETEMSEKIKKVLLEHHAISIVGGVVSQSAVQLAQLAQNFMIPAILLSQKSKLTQAGPFVFQNAVTHEHIIKNLVSTLIQKLNHTSFAILYPNDPFGIEYANLFWDYVLAQGGKISATQTYKPDETDFNDSIRRLTGTYYYEDRDEEFRNLLTTWFSIKPSKRNQKKLREVLPPIVQFSAIFIPDSIKSLKRIAPYFNFQNIEQVTFAGPSLWNSPRLLKQQPDLIEGAVFVSALIAHHPDFKNSSFFKNFKSTFNYSPGLFEFLAYQSALALRQALSTGSHTREELKTSLSKMNQLSSPVGTVKISKNREFIYPITQFSVKNSTINPL